MSVEQVRPAGGSRRQGPAAQESVDRILSRSWWYLPGITAASMAASGLLSPGVAWLVGIPFGWRLLAMSLLIPLLVAPAVAHRLAVMADRLEAVRRRVRMLSSLLPVCAWCRRIKDEAGDWQTLEGCAERHFPGA